MLRPVLISLCFATFAMGQNPAGYNTAFYAAKERGVPLVIFVGCDGRDIYGAEELECRKFPGTVGPVIIVGNTETLECRRLSPSATDAEILAAFPKRVASGLPAGKYITESGVVYREYYVAPTPAPPPRPTYTGPPAYYTPAPLSLSGGFQLGPVGAYGSFGAGGYCVGST